MHFTTAPSTFLHLFLYLQPEALAAKYRLSRRYYDGFYNKRVRPKLTDFLIDERKRQKKEENEDNYRRY